MVLAPLILGRRTPESRQLDSPRFALDRNEWPFCRSALTGQLFRYVTVVTSGIAGPGRAQHRCPGSEMPGKGQTRVSRAKSTPTASLFAAQLTEGRNEPSRDSGFRTPLVRDISLQVRGLVSQESKKIWLRNFSRAPGYQLSVE